MTTSKLFFISLLTAIVLAAPLMWLYNSFFPTTGFLGFPFTNNFYIASILGLTFSLPLSFGFYSRLILLGWRRIVIFTLLPAFTFDLIWFMIGWIVLLKFFLLSGILSIVGIIIGLLIRDLIKKNKKKE